MIPTLTPAVIVKFVLTPTALWIGFWFLLVAFSVQQLVLRYHWRNYAFPDHRLERMRQAYYVGAVAFFLLMLYAILNTDV